jgi:zinc transport system permease protein
MVFGAMLVGALSVVAGLQISLQFDVPSGATIVLLQALVFIFAAVLRRG